MDQNQNDNSTNTDNSISSVDEPQIEIAGEETSAITTNIEPSQEQSGDLTEAITTNIEPSQEEAVVEGAVGASHVEEPEPEDGEALVEVNEDNEPVPPVEEPEMSQELFDEMYGMYLVLEDEGAPQREIIVELKYILGQKGYSPNHRNILISQFFERFGITLSPEEINGIRIVNPFQDMLNSMISGNLNPVQNNGQDNLDEELDGEENEADNVPEPQLQLEFVGQNGNNQVINMPLGPGVFLNNNPLEGVGNLIPPGGQGIGNILMNMINMVNVPPAPMADVVTTLDNKDLEKLEEYELEEDMEGSCPISMEDFKKGLRVIKLPCNHIFEAEAIKGYLKEYSYKCPVCRKECGKGHHNL